MNVVRILALGLGCAALVAGGLVWVGRWRVPINSLRWNHAGVLLSAGTFCSLTAIFPTFQPDDSFLLVLGFVAFWLGSLSVFLWMFLQCPNKWSSRMAKRAEHVFEDKK